MEVVKGPWNVPLSRVGVVLPRALYGGE